ncbi:L-lactate permease [Aneurinibacillus tyrosinisolvens]|uniref:L-lactate permease n=1 Tax=Aneurinibacillus tyrosinisolvens TaxID=1443435 RepID=UPI00137927BF|nr:L-lactate permease [Aneurinibacillus tyrosinisolvens]
MNNVWLALLPLITVFLSLFVWKQSISKTGMYGFLAACIVGLLPMFGNENTGLVLEASTTGFFLALPVMYVLLSGLWMYKLMQQTGAMEQLTDWLEQVSSHPLRRTLLITAGVSPFLESAIGFGIAVVFAAPFFRTLHKSHTKTAILSLMTLHMVPWGAMAVGTGLGASIAGVPVIKLGSSTFVFSFFLIAGIVVASSIYSAGWQLAKEGWKDIVFALVALLSILYFVTTFVSVEIAGITAGLATTLLLVYCWRNREQKKTPSRAGSSYRLIIPLILFLGCILSTRLASWTSPSVSGWFVNHPYIYNPATYMIGACIALGILSQLKRKQWIQSVRDALRQVQPAALSTLTFVAMGTVMKQLGLSASLISSLPHTGSVYVWLAPFVGGMSGWLAGSNSGGNAMWMHIQAGMADSTGLPRDLLAAVQNTTASYLMMASPSRIALAAAVAGEEATERSILRTIALVSGSVLLFVTLELVFLVYFTRVMP